MISTPTTVQSEAQPVSYTISQIVIVWLIATAIGLRHLPHAVLGTTEVLAGFFSSSGITLADFGHFLFWTTLGNALGGTLFVALLKTSHAHRDTA